MLPPGQPFFSCDWGTTSFRLRFVSSQGEVLHEIREAAGVKALYELALERGAHTELQRAPIFADFMAGKLQELSRKLPDLSHRPSLVISGMASSTIGWKELPYASAPLPLDASQLQTHQLQWHGPKWLGPTYLVSGLATRSDIMRGEESEIIGLLSAPELSPFRDSSLLVLPGTHSKHVSINSGAIHDFRTYMTGELFELLARHSILRASVDLSACANDSQADRGAFCDGVRWGAELDLAAALFRVRTRAVLDAAPPAANTWFLSGLLIGAELSQLLSNPARPVLLASGRAVSHLYSLALQTLAPNNLSWQEIPPEQLDLATVRAHALLLRHLFPTPK